MKTFLRVAAVVAVLAGVAALVYYLCRRRDDSAYIPLDGSAED